MILAAREGHAEAVKLLLEAGADMEAKDKVRYLPPTETTLLALIQYMRMHNRLAPPCSRKHGLSLALAFALARTSHRTASVH